MIVYPFVLDVGTFFCGWTDISGREGFYVLERKRIYLHRLTTTPNKHPQHHQTKTRLRQDHRLLRAHAPLLLAPLLAMLPPHYLRPRLHVHAGTSFFGHVHIYILDYPCLCVSRVNESVGGGVDARSAWQCSVLGCMSTLVRDVCICIYVCVHVWTRRPTPLPAVQPINQPFVHTPDTPTLKPTNRSGSAGPSGGALSTCATTRYTHIQKPKTQNSTD